MEQKETRHLTRRRKAPSSFFKTPKGDKRKAEKIEVSSVHTQKKREREKLATATPMLAQDPKKGDFSRNHGLEKGVTMRGLNKTSGPSVLT